MSSANKQAQAREVAVILINGFNKHFRTFNACNEGAMVRFENADWHGVQAASRERIQGYDQRVSEAVEILERRLHSTSKALDDSLWQEVKEEYRKILQEHGQPELAESFYNSVFCNMYEREFFLNKNIFVKSSVDIEHIPVAAPILYTFDVTGERLADALAKMVKSFGFSLPFVDLPGDVERVTSRIVTRSWFDDGCPGNCRVDVINSLFFRNKAAYIIGRMVSTYGDQPFAIPVLNNEQGGLYLDTVILDTAEMNVLFGFARAYFMVETASPATLVNFLKRLLSRKSRTELYTHIGFQKHGKTQFYREFLEHLDHSTDNLTRAPGIEGMVMSVFTLPSFPYVFKIIKDKFPPEKDTTPEKIKSKYLLVKLHDRVGRMADTLEYSDVALPRSRFTKELLKELLRVAPSRIELSDNNVIIKHVYIERRVIPLNIYLKQASEDQIRHAIIDYGNAIKQMIAANIFPGDMLIKNFGVTSHKKVIFYDYDEVEYLTDVNFRKIPEPQTPEDEMAAAPWYKVAPNDVFPEQFLCFVLTNEQWRGPFLEKHAELLQADYWQARQQEIIAGTYPDVFPYPEEIRFSNFFAGD